MLTLLVDCHRCGHEFPSEVRLSEAGIEGRLMDGVVYQCPSCGLRDPYFTVEHHLPSAGGFALARPEPTRWSLPSRPRTT